MKVKKLFLIAIFALAPMAVTETVNDKLIITLPSK